MKQTAKVWVALGVALMFVLHVNANDVCPDTLSQGGTNTSSASFILHDSIGGVGGVSQTSASFQSDVGYAPQILSGCNCMPCDDFVSQACDALQVNQQTSVANALAFLETLLTNSDLYNVDICGDDSTGAGFPETCAAYILQNFQP